MTFLQLNDAVSALGSTESELAELRGKYYDLEEQARKLDAELATQFLEGDDASEIQRLGLRQVFQLLDVEANGEIDEETLLQVIRLG